MMKQVGFVCAAVLTVLGMTGCEWTGSGGDSTYNNAYSWANFTGVYRDPAGNYLVREFGVASKPSASRSIGTGNGLNADFGGTLSPTPLVKGSVTVTDGTETFTDPSGSGVLTGDHGGTGSVNYETGAINVSFKMAPGVGQSIIANYQYFAAGTPENPQSGASGAAIYTLNLVQEGNKVTMIDNNGARYVGSLVLLDNPGGRNPSTVQKVSDALNNAADQGITPDGDNLAAAITELSSEVVAQFEVKGTSVSGQHVTITGTLQLDPTTAKRYMRGTWVEAGGQTGDIIAEAPPIEAPTAEVQ